MITFPYAMIVTKIPGYYDLHRIINQQYYGTITAISIRILQRINKHRRHSVLFTHTRLYRTVKVVYDFVNTFKKRNRYNCTETEYPVQSLRSLITSPPCTNKKRTIDLHKSNEQISSIFHYKLSLPLSGCHWLVWTWCDFRIRKQLWEHVDFNLTFSILSLEWTGNCSWHHQSFVFFLLSLFFSILTHFHSIFSCSMSSLSH